MIMYIYTDIKVYLSVIFIIDFNLNVCVFNHRYTVN